MVIDAVPGDLAGCLSRCLVRSGVKPRKIPGQFLFLPAAILHEKPPRIKRKGPKKGSPRELASKP